MKRFFDLSLLILIPFLFVGQFNTNSNPDTKEAIAEGKCTLSCNPQNCCYHQEHL